MLEKVDLNRKVSDEEYRARIDTLREQLTALDGPVKEKKPTDKLADKTAMTKFLQGIFGDAQKKILKRMAEYDKVNP